MSHENAQSIFCSFANDKMKKVIPAVAGLVVAAGVAGGVTYAVVNKKKKQKSHANNVSPDGKPAPAPAPTSLSAPAVESTPLPVNMTDAQAEVWAGNLPVLTTGKDYHAGIAASTVLLPLMNMGMTADQLKKYNVSPPNATTRTIIERYQRDLVVPGVTMTDDQAKNYAANLKLWNSKTTSQADRNAAVRALAPIVGLRETGYQFSLFGGGPTDDLRAPIAADYATLQSTGNAPM